MSHLPGFLRLQNWLPYDLAKALLFSMSPETSHYYSMKWLTAAYRARLTGPAQPIDGKSLTIAGLHFPNKVGLAAGLDKNGHYIDALGSLGFGFIEVGTVTPKAQPGNPLPRLFRLKNHQAIINRMGFNNAGVEQMIDHLRRRSYTGPLGVNIGKNKNTPADQAINDYLSAMAQVFTSCDYLTANISSPNTKGLRDLQAREVLTGFLRELMDGYQRLVEIHQCRPPLFLKVAPDLNESQIEDIADLVSQYKVAGLIVSNTTLARAGVQHHIYEHQAGGLSGVPLFQHSTEVLRAFRKKLGPDMPIIGVGGISSLSDAQAKIQAGADLVQIYSGFIYEGPKLVRDIAYGL